MNEDTEKCGECKRDAPSHCLSPMFIGSNEGSGYTASICPLCALRITNDVHGVDRTEFTGTMAQQMLEECAKHYKVTGQQRTWK